MFKGFNLKINESFFTSTHYSFGISTYESDKKNIYNNIEKYVDNDGTLDGKRIIQEWFPNVKADVFISHSHKDRDLAIKFAGWLFNNFGIRSFIDSCVWGYAGDLLKIIDNKYCYKPDTKTYSYESRNYSTSHVHMMLSTALNEMIDNVECVFFLNTENSIQNAQQVIDGETKSPWIFSELETTRIIRERPISDYRSISETFSFTENFDLYKNMLSIKYRTNLNHLCDLNEYDLGTWKSMLSKYPYTHGLDILYGLIVKQEVEIYS